MKAPAAVLCSTLRMIAVSAALLRLPGGAAEAAPAGAAAPTDACSALSQFQLANTTVTSATMVAKGGAALGLAGVTDLPAFCPGVGQSGA